MQGADNCLVAEGKGHLAPVPVRASLGAALIKCLLEQALQEAGREVFVPCPVVEIYGVEPYFLCALPHCLHKVRGLPGSLCQEGFPFLAGEVAPFDVEVDRCMHVEVA